MRKKHVVVRKQVTGVWENVTTCDKDSAGDSEPDSAATDQALSFIKSRIPCP
jgi:hypothetical protein